MLSSFLSCKIALILVPCRRLLNILKMNECIPDRTGAVCSWRRVRGQQLWASSADSICWALQHQCFFPPFSSESFCCSLLPPRGWLGDGGLILKRIGSMVDRLLRLTVLGMVQEKTTGLGSKASVVDQLCGSRLLRKERASIDFHR